MQSTINARIIVQSFKPMALSVLIVEDEFIIVEDIRAALLANGYKVFGVAYSVVQVMELLKKGRPDFALVDITLGNEQHGLEIGRLFHEDLKIPYVYVTSHSDAGTLEKVKLTNPTGYLLKPFKREAIFTAIEVALSNFDNRQNAGRPDGNIIFRKGEEKTKVLFSEILFMESDGNYTHVQTVTARFTERKNLKEMLDDLSAHPFVRVHKSFAVNKNKIRNFTRERISMGEYDVPVGRAYYDELKQLF